MTASVPGPVQVERVPVRHVAISGELGSGKSAVAASLAGVLDARVVSTGAIHRRIAEERGQSALETNLAAEEDAAIDQQIDAELQRRGRDPEVTVFDSRMAWHFVPDALKVHLVVDDRVGAERMAGRSATAVETYGSVEEAVALAEERHASEQRRFLSTYDVDIDRLRNYDVVVDTSRAAVDEITAHLLEALHDPPDATEAPVLALDPRRLMPTRAEGAAGSAAVPVVGYSRPYFFVLEGHDAVGEALRTDRHLLRATLRAEGDEHVAGGVPARTWLREQVDQGLLDHWRATFGVAVDAPPPGSGPVEGRS